MKIKSRKDGRRIIQTRQLGLYVKICLPRGISSAEEKAVLARTKSRFLELRTNADKFVDWDAEEKTLDKNW